MFTGIAERSREVVRRLPGLVLRQRSRTARWALEALPEKRILWHRNRLSDAAGKLEKRFLAVSLALEYLAEKSALLLDNSRTLLKSSLGHEGGFSLFQSAFAVTERPLAFNDECVEITGKLDRQLGLVFERIGRLHRFKSTLDGSIAPLKILQTMFRIESADSSPEIQTLFTSLSAEIEDLLVRMSTMIVKEFEAIESTGATVNDVRILLREVRTRQIEAQKRRAEISESLSTLAVQVQINKQRDVRLVELMQALSEKLTGMVAALQYQDILNQRLQHVTRGLENIAEQSRVLEGNSDLEALNFLRDASRVESAQLEDVQCVFRGAVENLRSALDGLAEELGELGSECVLLNGVDSPSAASDGMVQVLLDIIHGNLELTQSTSERSLEICTALGPIGGLLGNLTGSILELSARIRLIALNAQIKAAQAGDGTGLEVLSFRARSIAEELAAVVIEITEELASLKEALSGGLEDIEQTRLRSMELLQFLREDCKHQEIQLHKFRDNMLTGLRNVEDLVAHVQSESRSISASLDMRSTVVDVINCTRRELQHFSERLSERLGRSARSPRLEQQAASYTAASERSAHERALRADSSTVVPFDSLPVTAEGSVELF